jgi:hypothetical protein
MQRRLPALLALIASTVLCAQPLRAENPTPYTAAADRVVDALDRHLAQGARIDARDLGYAAFAALLIHGDGQRAGRYLQREIEAQLPDGRYAWTVGQTDVLDANAIDFAMQSWGPILLRYERLLPPDARDATIASAARAIPALIAHHVSSDYTNIALMNGCDLLQLGYALHDDSAVSTGRERLQAVQAAIAAHGIGEFASPTYSSVQLSVLVNAYDSLPPGDDHDLVGDLLTKLWSDLASSAFDGRLAGAHSRDYSFVGTPGTIAAFFSSIGLAPQQDERQIPIYAATSVLYNDANGAGGFVVPASVIASGRAPRRSFTRPWGPKPEETRTTFIDGNVAIGTNAVDYPDGQEKPISADIAGVPGDISLNAVDTGDPYGVIAIVGKDGHAKPRELPLHATVTQDGGTVTGTADLDLAKSEERPVELSLLIPRSAHVTLNGTVFDTGAPGSRTVHVGDVVSIAGAGGSVTFRFTAFRGAQPASVELVEDAAGRKASALRVTASYDPSQGPAYASFEFLAKNDL